MKNSELVVGQKFYGSLCGREECLRVESVDRSEGSFRATDADQPVGSYPYVRGEISKVITIGDKVIYNGDL